MNLQKQQLPTAETIRKYTISIAQPVGGSNKWAVMNLAKGLTTRGTPRKYRKKTLN